MNLYASLCSDSHKTLVAGTCPWCGHPVLAGGSIDVGAWASGHASILRTMTRVPEPDSDSHESEKLFQEWDEQFAEVPTEALLKTCKRYWKLLARRQRKESIKLYATYVQAGFVLFRRCVDLAPRAIRLLRSARPCCARGRGILTLIAAHERLGEHREAALVALLHAATAFAVESRDEYDSFEVVTEALAEIGDPHAIPVLCGIVLRPFSGYGREIQWAATAALAILVNEEFLNQSDAVEAARTWAHQHDYDA